MTEVRVLGIEQLPALARRLKEAGRTGLDRKLNKAMRKSAKHIEAAVRDSVDDYLPNRYAKVFVVGIEFRIELRKARTSAQRLTVFTKSMGKAKARQIRNLEKGELRHPVYGRWRTRRGANRGKHAYRNPWRPQRIRPHLVTEPATAAKPKVREEIEQAMNEVAKQIMDEVV